MCEIMILRSIVVFSSGHVNVNDSLNRCLSPELCKETRETTILNDCQKKEKKKRERNKQNEGEKKFSCEKVFRSVTKFSFSNYFTRR